MTGLKPRISIVEITRIFSNLEIIARIRTSDAKVGPSENPNFVLQRVMWVGIIKLGLKIRVAAVRFRPDPPFEIKGVGCSESNPFFTLSVTVSAIGGEGSPHFLIILRPASPATSSCE